MFHSCVLFGCFIAGCLFKLPTCVCVDSLCWLCRVVVSCVVLVVMSCNGVHHRLPLLPRVVSSPLLSSPLVLSPLVLLCSLCPLLITIPPSSTNVYQSSCPPTPSTTICGTTLGQRDDLNRCLVRRRSHSTRILRSCPMHQYSATLVQDSPLGSCLHSASPHG